jgi:hypothetical protein
VEVAVDPTELLGCFAHARRAPAQHHLTVPPAFDVDRVCSADLDHGLDGVGRAQRPGQRRGDAEADDGGRLGQPFPQRPGRPGVGLVELAGQVLQLGRLLADLGLSESAVARIRDSLESAIYEGQRGSDLVEPAMTTLIADLSAELRRLHQDQRHEHLMSRVLGVFETLGGAMVVAANAAAGLPGAPLTGGVTVVGAAVSIAAGTEVISRGIDRAKQRD